MFTSVRTRRLFEKNGISLSELVLSGVLSILGAWLLGFGAALADIAGFAMAVSGGVMLFSGIALGKRLLDAVTKALQASSPSEDNTFTSSDSGLYNNLQNRVVDLERDARVLVGGLRRRGSSLFGR